MAACLLYMLGAVVFHTVAKRVCEGVVKRLYMWSIVGGGSWVPVCLACFHFTVLCDSVWRMSDALELSC
jgi:hypothetical protein